MQGLGDGMKTRWIILLSFLMALPAHGKREFLEVAVTDAPLQCQSEGSNAIRFGAAVHHPYSGGREIHIVECRRIIFGNQVFYTAKFDRLVEEGPSPKRVLTYEVILVQNETRKLLTVRSESVDVIDLTGDTDTSDFVGYLKVTWGKSSLDKQRPMMKVEIGDQKAEVSYILKLNDVGDWFVNTFEELDEEPRE